MVAASRSLTSPYSRLVGRAGRIHRLDERRTDACDRQTVPPAPTGDQLDTTDARDHLDGRLRDVTVARQRAYGARWHVRDVVSIQLEQLVSRRQASALGAAASRHAVHVTRAIPDDVEAARLRPSRRRRHCRRRLVTNSTLSRRHQSISHDARSPHNPPVVILVDAFR